MRVFSSWAMKRGASPDRRFAGMDCRMSFSRLWKRPSVVTKVSMLRLLLSSQTQRQKLNTAPLVLPVNSAIDYGHSRFSRCRFSSNSSTASTPLPSNKSKINFCQLCGGQTKFVIPDGDEKKRPVCTVCGKVYYENPKMVVGCLVEHDNKVLLCKRKIPPSYGLWTLPAGYLELGESAAAGAARETLEEACADVEIISPFAQLDIPRIGQSYTIFRAQLKVPSFSPGPESLECDLFQLDEIPFKSVAFSSIYVTLKMFIEDIKAGKFHFHYCIIDKRPDSSPSDTQGFIVSKHIRSGSY